METLVETLSRPSDPIGKRMRAAYYLRQQYDHNKDDDGDGNIQATVIQTLADSLLEKRHGSLLRHEFAYVMGQLREEGCRPTLEAVLSNEDDCLMVRHECAEALAAIGSPLSIEILTRFSTSPPKEVAETCRIALMYMRWKSIGEDLEADAVGCSCMGSRYKSVDPAPPHPDHVRLSVKELGERLLQTTNNDDSSSPATSEGIIDHELFDRFRCVFSLRNLGTDDAVSQLSRALLLDRSLPKHSALLRHEIAFVLGQMQNPGAISALETCLRDKTEHPMVRHEAAEALGAMEVDWDRCEGILREFCNKREEEDQVVYESCVVALDAADYWGHGNADDGEDDDVVVDNCEDSNGSQRGDVDVVEATFGKQKAITNGKKACIAVN